MSNRNTRGDSTRVFNPDDIIVRERQTRNATASGNAAGNRNSRTSQNMRTAQRANGTGTLTPKQAKKQEKKIRKHKRHKKFWFGFKIFMLICLLAILAALVVIYFKFGDDLLKWKMEATDIVENSTSDTFRASETSIIYASNKSMIAKLKGDKDSYYLTFDEIPQSVKDAMVVT